MNENYAVMDSSGFLSKILISLEEARTFKELSLNKEAIIIKFGWHKIDDTKLGDSE